MAYSISDLPLELLRVIALFLKAPSSDIANFALVCKWFNKEINHNYVWRQFTRRNCTQNFIERYVPDYSTAKPLIWKSFFKENYCSMNEKNISCGFRHTVFLVKLQNGEIQLFGCGANESGQLGLGDTKNRTKPQRITGFPVNSRILNFNCGLCHTVFLVKLQNDARQLFGCGANESGQLGLGDTKARFKPQRITGFPANSRILNFNCSLFFHTVFLVKLQNGEIQPFSCGDNTRSQLGIKLLAKIKNVTKLHDIRINKQPQAESKSPKDEFDLDLGKIKDLMYENLKKLCMDLDLLEKKLKSAPNEIERNIEYRSPETCNFYEEISKTKNIVKQKINQTTRMIKNNRLRIIAIQKLLKKKDIGQEEKKLLLQITDQCLPGAKKAIENAIKNQKPDNNQKGENKKEVIQPQPKQI